MNEETQEWHKRSSQTHKDQGPRLVTRSPAVCALRDQHGCHSPRHSHRSRTGLAFPGIWLPHRLRAESLRISHATGEPGVIRHPPRTAPPRSTFRFAEGVIYFLLQTSGLGS